MISGCVRCSVQESDLPDSCSRPPVAHHHPPCSNCCHTCPISARLMPTPCMHAHGLVVHVHQQPRHARERAHLKHIRIHTHLQGHKTGHAQKCKPCEHAIRSRSAITCASSTRCDMCEGVAGSVTSLQGTHKIRVQLPCANQVKNLLSWQPQLASCPACLPSLFWSHLPRSTLILTPMAA